MAKKFAMIFGWIFVVVGVLGFVPNPLVGEGAFFHADTAHNVFHLVSGAALLYVAYKATHKAATALRVLGVIYLVLAVLGFFTDSSSLLGVVEINDADNWLHLALGVLLLWGARGRRGGGNGGM